MTAAQEGSRKGLAGGAMEFSPVRAIWGRLCAQYMWPQRSQGEGKLETLEFGGCEQNLAATVSV